MEKQEKFTPGPWDIDGFNISKVIAKNKDGRYRLICDCHLGVNSFLENFNENVANAHLIAAAPELLEACKKALAELDFLKDYSPTRGKTAKLISDIIAKAEGGR
jgi:hypothetical protein